MTLLIKNPHHCSKRVGDLRPHCCRLGGGGGGGDIMNQLRTAAIAPLPGLTADKYTIDIENALYAFKCIPFKIIVMLLSSLFQAQSCVINLLLIILAWDHTGRILTLGHLFRLCLIHAVKTLG